jgi:hypothetical protein
MNLGQLGELASLLTTFIFAIGGLFTIRQRRRSREVTELRGLRDFNVAAMGYIYSLEMAIQEIQHKYPIRVKVEKPDILTQSYVEKRAESTQNTELQQMKDIMALLQMSAPKPVISGENESITQQTPHP